CQVTTFPSSLATARPCASPAPMATYGLLMEPRSGRCSPKRTCLMCRACALQSMGVFHMASPVTDDPEQVIEQTITGTRNVIDAAVRRVVLTSSVGAVYMNPNRGLDESCWSDLRHRKNTKVITIIIVNHRCLNLDSRLNHVNHESSITKVRRRQGRRRRSRKGGRGEGCQGALHMRREHAATGGGRPSEYSPSSSRSTPSPQSIPYLFIS
ncbi:unnamed protein product, partial [Musa hybrid cultivar]